MEKININDILNYKIKQRKDYSYGGFYLIKNIKNNKCYIGKSKDYLARLKQHTYKSSSKNKIDKEIIDNINEFEFYLLYKYVDLGINFFNRKLEIIIEHKLIKQYKSYYPFGYNMSYYEQI